MPANPITYQQLQREFASNSGDFNTLDTSGIVSVDPNSAAGQQIIDAWQSAIGPGFLRYRPGGVSVPRTGLGIIAPVTPAPAGAAAPTSTHEHGSGWFLALVAVLLLLVIGCAHNPKSYRFTGCTRVASGSVVCADCKVVAFDARTRAEVFSCRGE